MLTYSQAIRALKLKAGEDVEDTALLGRLMAYCSKVLGMMMMMVKVMAYCSKVLGMMMVTFGMLLRRKILKALVLDQIIEVGNHRQIEIGKKIGARLDHSRFCKEGSPFFTPCLPAVIDTIVFDNWR